MLHNLAKIRNLQPNCKKIAVILYAFKNIVMKFRYIIVVLAALLCSFTAHAQDIDTTGIYGPRADSLEASVFVAKQSSLPKLKTMRTEVITAAGLCKMACCSVAESFENSASVSVGYSDAVTGARQIKLLGLSGVYTQMLDAGRPVMRGLSAPWGLTYIPGQWLQSIQIAKGATSVLNGIEGLTGQINLEHRKPTDEIPLFINAAFMSEVKADLNVASSNQINDKWYTVVLAHADKNFLKHDMNKDGFLDDPMAFNVGLSNRWLYRADNGLQVRFGVRGTRDQRAGGTVETEGPAAWRTNILNQSANGYVKVGYPLNDDGTTSIAFVGDYTYQNMQSNFGPQTLYNPSSHSAVANFLYQNQDRDWYHFTVGASATFDAIKGDLSRMGEVYTNLNCNQLEARVFSENTFKTLDDKFSAIVGLSLNYYNVGGKFPVKVVPRVSLKYAPIDDVVLRANAGRGLRFANPLIDNIGVLSTNKIFTGFGDIKMPLEDAWTMGGNVTYYISALNSSYVSVDYFHSRFANQLIMDYSATGIDFYMSNGAPSYTHTVQADLNIEPVERFTITLTGRYTSAKTTYAGRGLCDKPMTSAYKGVLNLQYATHLNKWIFDATISVNGPCRVWDFMKELKDVDGNLLYANGKTPVYPLLYLQVTKRFKGVDIYVGGENLTNFRQKNVIIGDVASAGFDASQIWGPLMGVKAYIGVRFTLWKTN